MSVDEVEPIEEEAADENAVATRGTHLASTQTITHEYLTQSGKVMRETVKTDGTVTAVLDFIYDESGKPFAMIDQLSAQPKTYYYVLNLQGDVVKLIDQDGAEAAAYTYDAWGNILSQSGSMASANPLRYRGYYHDSETGFYYLQSRYYDPKNHRFINADVYASTGQGFVGTNMFAYCGNNPMCYSDPDGMRYIDPNIISHGNGRAEYTDTGTRAVSILPDVTEEVNRALQEEIYSIRATYGALIDDFEHYEIELMYIFYKKVKKEAAWDIKVGASWTNTIGTEYPGEGARVIYCGYVMRLEDLGNYTYGCLGRVYGFDLGTLYWGSEYAAGFPEYGTEAWDNEYLRDQFFIQLGYMCGYKVIFK